MYKPTVYAVFSVAYPGNRGFQVICIPPRWQRREGVNRHLIKSIQTVPISEFFFGDRVPFSASDSGSLWKCTNQSQSLPHFVAKKKFTGSDP
jgi:hypothetical protein